eukprot:Gregarina_sp_Poly_1__6082@NODE_3209_length_1275_cov_156_341887_g2039_i0_p1_GENE_NODE_3209_length_1275_cov_156_341887_g2039_i0NODE_3209_length_1275_cov_156_341887_g2039_i0_p1_ORF_typecomplete_len139_score14_27AAAATPase_like/PF09820_9/2_6e03AAAATPase_like/PF09820_9/0_00083_NODE_3209_length_1275_cov_156_341887_g2039_i08201236
MSKKSAEVCVLSRSDQTFKASRVFCGFFASVMAVSKEEIVAAGSIENVEEISRRYSTGLQEFETLREPKCVYIDKTDIIHKLMTSLTSCFLSGLTDSARVFSSPPSKSTFREEKSCSKGWPSTIWSTTGRFTQFYTLI